MLKKNNSATKKFFAGLFVILLCLAIATSLANTRLAQQKPAGSSALKNAEERTLNTFVQPQETSPQFDLSRNVIAGGGGSSTAGTLKVEGTIGQSAAGTTMTGGQFSQTSGFWQPLSGVMPTPSPSPTATPTPTPTPTPFPTPSAPVIFIAEGTINQAATIDSVTFVRSPFSILTDRNFSQDHHRRLLIFTSNLGLNQPDASILTVQAAGFTLTVEFVGMVSGVTGLDASFIIVRLPDGLPAGTLPLTVTLRGVVSSNAPTITISP